MSSSYYQNPNRAEREETHRRVVADDEKAYDLSIREVPRTPPTVGIFDAPFRCYRVNLEWDKHIGGAIQVLAEWKAWTGDEDERNIGTQAILEYLAQNIVCGDEELPTLFRQNPANNCQLQQSLDGGETWETIFDFSLCELNVQVSQSGSVYDFSRDSVSTMNEYVENYTTINEFAPALVYDESGQDIDRDQALCFTLGAWYDTAKEVYAQKLQTSGGYQTIALGVAAALGAVLTAITFGLAAVAAGAIGAVAAAVVAGMIEIGVNISANVSRDQWGDYKDDIVCCIYSNIKGGTLTQEAFQAMMLGCDTDETSGYIIDALEELTSTDESYVTFLKLWEQGYSIGQVGILPACPCEEEWTEVFDFAVSNGGWEIFSTGTGLWQSGLGWRTNGNDLSIIVDVSAIHVTEYKVEYTITTLGSAHANKKLFMQTRNVGDIQVTLLVSAITASGSFSATYLDEFDAYTYLRASLALNWGGTFGTGYISKITVSGTGANPF